MNQTMNQEKPVFVRGLSRSGGTLLCTILDAHSDLAISYELYPNMLLLEKASNLAVSDLSDFLDALVASRQIKDIPIQAFPLPSYRVFFLRLERGGVSKVEAENLLAQALKQGITFTTRDACSNFVKTCCSLKMTKCGKLHWGAKMNNRISDYLDKWPKAKCIDIVRDGRDVAASQLELGSFGKSVEQVADSWRKTHERFLTYQASHPENVRVIKYEDLIFDSENSIQKLCEFIEIPFDVKMMNYHKEDLTLFEANHMSKKNVMSGINSKSVGKWKNVLSHDQVNGFNSVAGEMLTYFNYTS